MATKIKTVDDLYNEFLHVERSVKPGIVNNAGMREVIESAWNNGETVKVLCQFKAAGKIIKVGDDYKPEYKKDIPRMLKLCDGNKRYFVPNEAFNASKAHGQIKELNAKVKHDYSLLTKARNQVDKAKQAVVNAMAAVDGCKAEVKRAKGQVSVFEKKIKAEIEGVDLDEILKGIE